MPVAAQDGQTRTEDQQKLSGKALAIDDDCHICASFIFASDLSKCFDFVVFDLIDMLWVFRSLH